jgi:LPS sulfotransferase NodH
VKLHWGQLLHLTAQLGGADTVSAARAALSRCFPDARFLLLARADRARQAISLHRAVRSDAWWTASVEDGRPAPLPAPRAEDLAEVARLERELADHEACWRELFASGDVAQPLEILYEDLAASYEATVRRVFAFLGVAVDDVPPAGLRRQADASTEAWAAAYAASRRQHGATAGSSA